MKPGKKSTKTVYVALRHSQVLLEFNSVAWGFLGPNFEFAKGQGKNQLKVFIWLWDTHKRS